MDVVMEVTLEVTRLPPFQWLRFTLSKNWKRTKRTTITMRSYIISTLSRIGSSLCLRSDHGEESDVDVEKGCTVAIPAQTLVDPASGAISAVSNKASSSAERLSSVVLNSPTQPQSMPTSPTSPALPSSTSAASLSLAPSDTAASTEDGQASTVAKRRFANVVRNMMTARRLGMGIPMSPADGTPARMHRTKSLGVKEHEELLAAPNKRVSRVASLIPALKSLAPIQLFQPHTALVRHLQFSPNGEFLATCRLEEHHYHILIIIINSEFLKLGSYLPHIQSQRLLAATSYPCSSTGLR